MLQINIVFKNEQVFKFGLYMSDNLLTYHLSQKLVLLI